MCSTLMPWSSIRRLPSTLCQLVGSTVVAGRELLAGEGGSASPLRATLSPVCPSEPHPRSSIAASASTGTVTVTDVLVELGLFLLRGHRAMGAHSVWQSTEATRSQVPECQQQAGQKGRGLWHGITCAAGGGR